MTLREKQADFWVMVAHMISRSQVQGTPIFILEWMRTVEQQKEKVRLGYSKTMNSRHLDGLAVDIIFLDDVRDDGKVNYKADKYANLGVYWETLGGRWGGRFGDNPATPQIEGWDPGHFEYKEKA